MWGDERDSGSSSSGSANGQWAVNSDYDMEASQDVSTQDSADVTMAEADSYSCNGEQCADGADGGDSDDESGWPLDEVEMHLGDDGGDDDEACGIHQSTGIPPRQQRGKTQQHGQCRWRTAKVRRSERQLTLELLAVEGEREHDDPTIDDDESSEDDGVDGSEKAEEAAGAENAAEGATKGAGDGTSGSARERGTRGTKRPGQRKRKRKHKDVTRGGSDGDVES